MEENRKLLESLLQSTIDYGKTSYELAKLKVLDKGSTVISSFISRSVVVVLIASFTLFLNLGIAFWLGEILGKIYLGFFVVAAFYGIVGIFIYFFLRNWINKLISNYLIKKMLK